MNKQVSQKYLVDTGRKLNVHKTFRRRPVRGTQSKFENDTIASC